MPNSGQMAHAFGLVLIGTIYGKYLKSAFGLCVPNDLVRLKRCQANIADVAQSPLELLCRVACFPSSTVRQIEGFW